MADIAQSGATKSWEPGKIDIPAFLERYQILGIIGQGGMGTVFKAYHLNLKRHVAIKTLRVDKIATVELVSRFRQEMELIGQMDHANVVRATDAGEKNGVFYLVMDFLSGCDLGTLVAKRGPLDLPNACELIRQAALGLDYIHQTLVHRDIKPSNLMLTNSGQVKVLDLGLAHCDLGGLSDRETTPQGYAVGTFAYMAPEQAAGTRAIDGRADIYSLGCTLFKLLTGKAPYSGPEYDNAAKLLYAHGNVPLTMVQEFHAMPEKIKPVLLRMTAKNPDERYRSGREVAEALAPLASTSNPGRLVAEGGTGLESVVRPLVHPIPDELSRLTKSLAETPSPTPTASTVAVAPRRRWFERKLPRTLAACVVAVALALPVLYVAIPDRKVDPPGPQAENNKAPLRSLDDLKRDQPFPLLDRKPLPIGGDLDNPVTHHWDEAGQFLTVTGDRNLLFLLGTTTLPSFDFEVRIKQKPDWTGDVGISWGYREDKTLKDQKVPRQDFAWFHYLRIVHQASDKGEPARYVQRGKGSLCYGQQLDVGIRLRLPYFEKNIQQLIGQVQVKIEVAGNRLARAEVGGQSLTDLLCTAEANAAFHGNGYQGGIGFFSLSHPATFSEARFVSRSKN
jgi:serine/threonine protein kinase